MANDNVLHPARQSRPLTGKMVLLWLIGFFGVIFTANGVFIWVAMGSFPGVVVESSYKASQAYNHEIEEAREQAQRGWDILADIDQISTAGGPLTVSARDKDGHVLAGLHFTAQLKHSVHATHDVKVELVEGQTGVYTGVLPAVAGGNWGLTLEAYRGDERVFKSENKLFLAE